MSTLHRLETVEEYDIYHLDNYRLNLNQITDDALLHDTTAPSSTSFDQNVQVPEHPIKPKLKQLTSTFKLLQLWEGNVISINNQCNEFTAIIHDKTNRSLPDEEITLSIDEIPRDDLPLLANGAIFYWSIGYADRYGLPRNRESRIRFRRLPRWSKKELHRAKVDAEILEDFFNED